MAGRQAGPHVLNIDHAGAKDVVAVSGDHLAALVTLTYSLCGVKARKPSDGDIEYWASSDLGMHEMQRVQYAGYANNIEQYHRGIKQFCGIERCQAHGARAQRSHIGLALRAFLRLESHCFHAGISWFAAKTQIVRDAVRAYLARPQYHLIRTA